MNPFSGLPPFSYDELQKNIGGLVYPNGIQPDGMSQEQMFRQGVGQLGAGMLAASNKNPMQALGMSYLQAQNQGLDNARQTMVAKEFAGREEDRKRKREEEDARRKGISNFLGGFKDLPPEFQQYAQEDPEGALQLFTKRYQSIGGDTTLDMLTGQQIAGSGGEDYSQNLTWAQSPDGKMYPVQVGDRGGTKRPELEPGHTWVSPPEMRAAGAGGAEFEKQRNELRAKLPQIIGNYDLVKETIRKTFYHPGLTKAVGTIKGLVPDAATGVLLGPEAKDFVTYHNQNLGQAFLLAFDTLRGGGQITEAEGKKATEAKARMDRATTPKEYRQALNDFWSAYDQAIKKMEKFANTGEIPSTGGGSYVPVENGSPELDQLMQKYGGP